MILPIEVEFDKRENSVVVEITEDMVPLWIEMEKGDTIRFRDYILTVPRGGTYQVHAHGVSQLSG